MNNIFIEIGNLESNDIHKMDSINWLVSKNIKTKLLNISIVVESQEGYAVLHLDEESWENLKEDVDEMIYEMYFGNRKD